LLGRLGGWELCPLALLPVKATLLEGVSERERSDASGMWRLPAATCDSRMGPATPTYECLMLPVWSCWTCAAELPSSMSWPVQEQHC